MDIQAKITEHQAELARLEAVQQQNIAAVNQTAVAIHERRGAVVALQQLLEAPDPA
jgi:hypothetical protein